MGRPRTFTDDEIIAKHASAETVGALAVALNASLVTTYRHLRRLKLSTDKFTKQPMGPKPRANHTPENIRRCAATAVTVDQVAECLGASETTTARLLKRHGISLGTTPEERSRIKPAQRVKIFEAYKDAATVDSLAKDFGISTGTARRVIQGEIERRWSSTTRNSMPRPRTLAAVKVYNLLRDRPEKANKPPEEVAKQLRIPADQVVSYVERMRAA